MVAGVEELGWGWGGGRGPSAASARPAERRRSSCHPRPHVPSLPAFAVRLFTSCLGAMPSCCTVSTSSLESLPMIFVFLQSLGFLGLLWTWSELSLETPPRGRCQPLTECSPYPHCSGSGLPPPPNIVPVLIVLARAFSAPFLSFELVSKTNSIFIPFLIIIDNS